MSLTSPSDTTSKQALNTAYHKEAASKEFLQARPPVLETVQWIDALARLPSASISETDPFVDLMKKLRPESIFLMLPGRRQPFFNCIRFTKCYWAVAFLNFQFVAVRSNIAVVVLPVPRGCGAGFCEYQKKE